MKPEKSLNEIKKGSAVAVVTSDQIENALKLYDFGASYVIMPHFLGGKHASKILQAFGDNIDKLTEVKINHLSHLQQRKNMMQEHPRAL